MATIIVMSNIPKMGQLPTPDDWVYNIWLKITISVNKTWDYSMYHWLIQSHPSFK